MWIVILNFCFFLLLISVFFYGFKHWRGLINEADEDEPVPEQTDFFFQRLPFWILIAGCGLYSIIADLVSLLG